ncbi:MAG: hypothetical protein OEW37_07780 [Rhodospirillaceae bacterium]|nr:hypothetical protein [Rhodospirillaceae bacterium]
MKNKNMWLILVAVGGVYWYQKKRMSEAQAESLQTFGFSVPGLKADHFGRPATIDGVTGILV